MQKNMNSRLIKMQNGGQVHFNLLS